MNLNLQINISYLYCQTAKVLNGEIIFVKETIDMEKKESVDKALEVFKELVDKLEKEY